MRNLLGSIVLCLLAACALEAERPPAASAPAGPPTATEPEPATEVVAVPAVGTAAGALLAQARERAESGDGEGAAALLQRAIRIEPENPWLWHRLAVLRLQQGRTEEARGNALKSISLAGGNERLIAGNREVIRRAGQPARQ